MEMASKVTSFLLFLVVFAYTTNVLADLGGEDTLATAPSSSLGWQQETNNTLYPVADNINRRRKGEKCGKADIKIIQGAPEQQHGIPTYIVEIINTCVTCTISNIHVNCGKFSSAQLVNPNTFKRLSIGDCLVNGGKPLLPGRLVSFKYANTFKYDLSVSSVACHS